MSHRSSALAVALLACLQDLINVSFTTCSDGLQHSEAPLCYTLSSIGFAVVHDNMYLGQCIFGHSRLPMDREAKKGFSPPGKINSQRPIKHLVMVGSSGCLSTIMF